MEKRRHVYPSTVHIVLHNGIIQVFPFRLFPFDCLPVWCNLRKCPVKLVDNRAAAASFIQSHDDFSPYRNLSMLPTHVNQTPPIQWPFICDDMCRWVPSMHNITNKWPPDVWVWFTRLHAAHWLTLHYRSGFCWQLSTLTISRRYQSC